MTEIIFDAFSDTVKMLPLLLAIYIGIELFEYKFGDAIISRVRKAGAWGPLAGALAGIFPQCGFSVIATALFTQKLVTIGTLLAVYLSTSDEALPIILSQPDKAAIIIPLVLTKFFIAIAAGYAIDFAYKKGNKKILAHISDYSRGTDDKKHHHESALDERACCGHSAAAASKKFSSKEIFLHPLIHTLKIFIFIFAVSVLIGYAIESIGQNIIAEFFATHAIFAPFAAALVGMIPNCAASVAITEMYLGNLISYGTAIAGLSASAGLGILVLLKEETNKTTVLAVIGLLFSISVFSGLVIQLLP